MMLTSFIDSQWSLLEIGVHFKQLCISQQYMDLFFSQHSFRMKIVIKVLFLAYHDQTGEAALNQMNTNGYSSFIKMGQALCLVRQTSPKALWNILYVKEGNMETPHQEYAECTRNPISDIWSSYYIERTSNIKQSVACMKAFAHLTLSNAVSFFVKHI